MSDDRDTEAPTSAATAAALNFDALPDEAYFELQFVTLMLQHYSLKGQLMSASYAESEYNIDEEEFNDYMGRSGVIEKLTEKGVIKRAGSIGTKAIVDKPSRKRDTVALGYETNEVVPVSSLSETAGMLSPMQYMVANALLDLRDTRSDKKKLQDHGISTELYARWEQEPVFNNYLRQRAEKMIDGSQHEAHLALIDKVKMGDMSAIKYYNEMVERFVPVGSQRPGEVSSGQIGDVKRLIVSIIEIINDNVDGGTALIISEKIQGLITASSTANQLVEHTIEQPNIKESRTLSPMLKKMLDEQGGEV